MVIRVFQIQAFVCKKLIKQTCPCVVNVYRNKELFFILIIYARLTISNVQENLIFREHEKLNVEIGAIAVQPKLFLGIGDNS